MFSSTKEKKELEELSTKKNQIEKGTKVTGDIEAQGNIRVDGEILGNIFSQSKVVLGASCKMKGNLKAKNAEISGHLEGTIEIEEQLILKSTAVITGDIITSRKITEDGAIFNGTCKMKGGGRALKLNESKAAEKTA